MSASFALVSVVLSLVSASFALVSVVLSLVSASFALVSLVFFLVSDVMVWSLAGHLSQLGLGQRCAMCSAMVRSLARVEKNSINKVKEEWVKLEI